MAALNSTFETTGASSKSTVLFAELGTSEPLPANVAVNGYVPAATEGVTEHAVVPAVFVVAMQVWPATVKVTGTPLTAVAGVTETSTSVAVSGNG